MYISNDPEIDVEAIPPLLQWFPFVLYFVVPALWLFGAIAYGLTHEDEIARRNADRAVITDCQRDCAGHCLSPEFRRSMKEGGE